MSLVTQVGDYHSAEESSEELRQQNLAEDIKTIDKLLSASASTLLTLDSVLYKVKYPQILKKNKELVFKLLDNFPETAVNLIYKNKIPANKNLTQLINDLKENFEDTSSRLVNNPVFFQYMFMALATKINKDNLNAYQGSEQLRKNEPEKAAAELGKMLQYGTLNETDASLLYKLAVKEEVNSQSYMYAVFCQSVEKVSSQEREELAPITYITGPSGSGKSTAAKAAQKVLDRRRMKTCSGKGASTSDSQGTYSLSIDGGIARAVSQIQKTAIHLSLNLGYPGVRDVYSKGKSIEKVKKRLWDVAKISPHLRAIVPLTLSDYFLPKSWGRRIMEESKALKRPMFIFRVEGDDPKTFQTVVEDMGERRAWFTGKAVKKNIDANNKKLPESKPYNPVGFIPGQVGSKSAEFFEKFKQSCTCMIIKNDLMRFRNDAEKGWVPAALTERSDLLVSKRVYYRWLFEQKDQGVGLDEFKDKVTVEPLIWTHNYTAFNKKLDKFLQLAVISAGKISFAEKEKQNPDETELRRFEHFQTLVIQLMCLDITKREEITSVIDSIEAHKKCMEDEGLLNYVTRLYDRSVLDNLTEILKKMKLEAEDISPNMSEKNLATRYRERIFAEQSRSDPNPTKPVVSSRAYGSGK